MVLGSGWLLAADELICAQVCFAKTFFFFLQIKNPGLPTSAATAVTEEVRSSTGDGYWLLFGSFSPSPFFLIFNDMIISSGVKRLLFILGFPTVLPFQQWCAKMTLWH